ncbi:MAG: hypothetical protein H7Y42_13915 [Chitinophagaceae bacterium]|nr:hypothetical protein [Chitinophagaceae bacterium]
MSERRNLRELSREGWNGVATVENINSGSLQRIADSLEKIALNHKRLQDDLAWTERRLKEERESGHRLRRSNAAFKGHITRLKK